MANKTITELVNLPELNQDAQIAVFKDGKTYKLSLNNLRDHLVGDFFDRIKRAEDARAASLRAAPVGTSYMLNSPLIDAKVEISSQKVLNDPPLYPLNQIVCKMNKCYYNLDNLKLIDPEKVVGYQYGPSFRFHPDGSGLKLEVPNNLSIAIQNDSTTNDYIIGMQLHGMSNLEGYTESLIDVSRAVTRVARKGNMYYCQPGALPNKIDIQGLSTQMMTFKLVKTQSRRIYFRGSSTKQKTTPFRCSHTSPGVINLTFETITDAGDIWYYVPVLSKWRFITVKAIKI